MTMLDLAARAPRTLARYVTHATPERTFKIFRATPRRTARQNAARFIARLAARGEMPLNWREVVYDGQKMIAVNYLGAVSRQPVRCDRQKSKRWSVASDGSRWPM
jgi:hypothetical protein